MREKQSANEKIKRRCLSEKKIYDVVDLWLSKTRVDNNIEIIENNKII